ncbi:MAG: hypothetical protein AAGA73_22445 [Pseudomonadota bacterium]
MKYLRDHWLGKHSLSKAFWVNFFILFVLILFGETTIRPPIAGRTLSDIVIAVLYLMGAYLIILPWQLVGLWRSSQRHVKEQGGITVATFAQAGAVVALITAVGSAATSVQRTLGLDAVRVEDALIADYQLRVVPADRAVVIEGQIGNGLSRDMKALLAKERSIERIILNSNGGRIFEARGVARQIIDRGLDTFVAGHCRSACTIVFIAGQIRSLGKDGVLGFHSYRLNGVMAFIDPEEEQEKDRAFFLRQGLDPSFVEQIFMTPHDDMWHPQPEHLLDAGVIHQIVPD